MVLSLKRERIFVVDNPFAEKTLSPDFLGAKNGSGLRIKWANLRLKQADMMVKGANLWLEGANLRHKRGQLEAQKRPT